MRLIAILLLAFFIVGCGYKPSSVAARDILGSSVWIDVIISKIDPESSVVIKDGIKSALTRIIYDYKLYKDFGVYLNVDNNKFYAINNVYIFKDNEIKIISNYFLDNFKGY